MNQKVEASEVKVGDKIKIGRQFHTVVSKYTYMGSIRMVSKNPVTNNRVNHTWAPDHLLTVDD